MNPLRITQLFILLLICNIGRGQEKSVYKLKSGKVSFSSFSAQELIHASSNQLKGLIDPNKKTFAFSIEIISFMGFNSELQREHFNENYMETPVYPIATYLGKIIEDIDLQQNGEYNVRAKGKLKIHGVEQERIVKTQITCKDGTITIHSLFNVLLSEHNIKIPRIVNNKISNNINITVDAIFVRST